MDGPVDSDFMYSNARRMYLSATTKHLEKELNTEKRSVHVSSQQVYNLDPP